MTSNRNSILQWGQSSLFHFLDLLSIHPPQVIYLLLMEVLRVMYITSSITDNPVIMECDLHKLLGSCITLYWSPKPHVGLFCLLLLSIIPRHQHNHSGFNQRSILYCTTFPTGTNVKWFKKSWQACWATYCATFILLACSYIFLWAIDRPRPLWPWFATSSGHHNSIFRKCFPPLLLMHISAWKIVTFLIPFCNEFQLLSLFVSS